MDDMRKSILTLVLTLIAFLGNAQEAESKTKAEKPNKFENIDERVGLAIKVNTFGLGGEFTMPLNERFSIRVGASKLQDYKADEIEAMAIDGVSAALDISFMDIDLGDFFDYQLAYNVSSFNLLADWYFTKRSPFHLTGGLRFSNTYFRNTLGIKQSISILDGLEISPENFGTLTLQVDYPFVLPYVGVGVGRLVNNKKIGFNFEIGNSFISGLNVSEFSGTGRIGGTAMEENRIQIEQNIAWVWAHPNVEISISYNFK
jgi:hypothetical protein